MHSRIGNDREVEQPRLRVTRRDEERIGDPVPIGWSAVVEVDVDLRIEIRVEPEVWVRRVKARETAVAEDCLRPRYRRAGRFKRTVILRSALHVLRIGRVYGQALELQGLQPLIQACPRRRSAG